MRNKNVKLLKDVLELINKEPTKHDQNSWLFFDESGSNTMCQTTMCVAGHAAVLAGAKIPTREQYSRYGWTLNEDGSLVTHDRYWTGEGITVSYFAHEKLGMNEDENDYIFYCYDNGRVKARIEQLIDLWENGEEFSYGIHPAIYAN